MGYKEKTPDDVDFKPWLREEGKRRKPYRMPSIPKRTSQTARLKCKPKIAGQEYLDLYILLKQKERHEKYGNTLFNRQDSVSDEWKEFKKEIYKMEASLPTVARGGTDEEKGGEKYQGVDEGASKDQKPKKKVPRGIKTKDWDY